MTTPQKLCNTCMATFHYVWPMGQSGCSSPAVWLSWSETNNIFERARKNYLCSDCGQWLWLFGRAVASDTKGPRFKSSHRQNLYWTLFTTNCIENSKINENEAGNGPFFKKSLCWIAGYKSIVRKKMYC